MDFISVEKRSFIMSRIRSKSTKPELVMRTLLREMGIKYRLDSKLAGRPDIKITGQKTVVFIDGCFWHGCNKHFKMPTSNIDFWEAKMTANRLRDKRNTRKLKSLGYTVIRVWEHEFVDLKKLENKLRMNITVIKSNAA